MQRRTFFLILGIAFGIRLLILGGWYASGHGAHESSDTLVFLEMAKGLADGRGFIAFGEPTMRRVPLYAIAVAPFIKLHAYPLGLQLMQCFFGALTCGLTYRMAKACGFTEKIAQLALTFMTLDYLAAKQTVYLLPETFYVFWVIFSFLMLFYALSKLSLAYTVHAYWYFAIAGFSAGLSVLSKESLSLFYPALAMWLVLTGCKNIRRWKGTAVFLTVYLAVLSPWVIRNTHVFKAPVFLTQSAGLTVYLGNNSTVKFDLYGGDWREGVDTQYPGDAESLISTIVGETDKHYLQQALNFISNEPVFFLRNSAVKLIRFWYPFYSESPRAIQIYTGIFNLAIFGLALAGAIWLPWGNVLVYAYPLLAYLSLIHAVTVPSVRYRYVLMPFLMILAAYAVENIWFKYREKRAKMRL